MIYSHFCTYNSKVDDILQSDSMKVNDREGSGRPRVTLSNFRMRFSSKNVWFWTSLISGLKNVIFISVRCLEMLKIAVWKMTSSTVLGLYVCQKIDISTWNLSCQISRHGPTPYCTVFENYKYFGFQKMLYKNFSFFYFWVRHFFGKSEKAILKNSLFYVFWCFLFAFRLKSLFLVIFKYLSIFDQKCHYIGSLTSI